MSEDRTGDMQNARSFEDRVLDELGSINRRLSALENKVDTLDKKVDALDNRVHALENKVDSLDKKVGALEIKVDSLEEKVDRRLQETRPMWEAMQAQLNRIEVQLEENNFHVKTLINDSFKLRSRVERLEDRAHAS